VQGKILAGSKVDWDEAQQRRDEGMTIRGLADIFGVSRMTICNNTKPK
jgi:predicted transcriptional regulator